MTIKQSLKTAKWANEADRVKGDYLAMGGSSAKRLSVHTGIRLYAVQVLRFPFGITGIYTKLLRARIRNDDGENDGSTHCQRKETLTSVIGCPAKKYAKTSN